MSEPKTASVTKGDGSNFSSFRSPGRLHAVLASLPLAAVAIALLELTRVPRQVLDPMRELALLSTLVRDAAHAFALPALLVIAAGAAAAWRTDRRRLRAGLLVALGIAQAGYAREVLIEYPPFAWSHAVSAAFAALGLALGGAHLLLLRQKGAPALGAALVLGSLVLARAHYAVYVGVYPTLHQCLLVLCFVGCALGLALALRAVERPVAMRRTAALLAASLLPLALIEMPAAAWARPVVIAYTELGRGAGVAEALERDRELLLPETLPGPRDSTLLAPDPDAEARFAENSNLPPLGVSLEDHDVLLILADATRFDRTSLADPSLDTTPRLRAFADEAHVFTRAYAPSNGTFPSLAAMLAMTPVSFAPLDLERRFWRGELRGGRPNAVEAMREAGRATFWVGHDHDRCFSEHIRGLERGFETRTLIGETRGDPADADVDARIADAAVRTLRARDGRFFGLVFLVSPHDDYRGGYDAELRRMDRALGRVLDAVDLERTIVVIAGDHGEALGDHGHEHHLSSVYDEQIHVPLVVRVPGVEGARHDAPVSTAHVLPWLLLEGAEAERRAARTALRDDVGPLMRALDGAVVSEMIGPRRQQVALIREDTTVVYDVLADLARVFDARDRGQLNDLREADPARLERALPLVRRYRRARYDGRRFRFVWEGS